MGVERRSELGQGNRQVKGVITELDSDSLPDLLWGLMIVFLSAALSWFIARLTVRNQMKSQLEVAHLDELLHPILRQLISVRGVLHKPGFPTYLCVFGEVEFRPDGCVDMYWWGELKAEGQHLRLDAGLTELLDTVVAAAITYIESYKALETLAGEAAVALIKPDPDGIMEARIIGELVLREWDLSQPSERWRKVKADPAEVWPEVMRHVHDLQLFRTTTEAKRNLEEQVENAITAAERRISKVVGKRKRQ
jgi:hypothetical protein